MFGPMMNMMPGMMPGMMGGGMNPMMGGMNPMAMMQTMMSPQQPQLIQPATPVLNALSSVDTINRAILEGLTKVHTTVGEKEGTLSTMLLNSGLTTEQLEEAINLYKSQIKRKTQPSLEEV